MSKKTKKKKVVKNPCRKCGKEVTWGKDGCPVVSAQQYASFGMGVLFGQYDVMEHYDC